MTAPVVFPHPEEPASSGRLEDLCSDRLSIFPHGEERSIAGKFTQSADKMLRVSNHEAKAMTMMKPTCFVLTPRHHRA
jgi:hypothetical protein